MDNFEAHLTAHQVYDSIANLLTTKVYNLP
jgi:hypothetical protein